MKKQTIIIFIIIVSFIFAACDSSSDSGDSSDDGNAGNITSFWFLEDNGNNIPEDYYAYIDDQKITAFFPVEVNISSLTPCFSHTGNYIEVNGIEQISGTTAQDFSSTVVYELYQTDGIKKNYTVEIGQYTIPALASSLNSWDSSSQLFYDDGITSGDVKNDNIWTVSCDIPANTDFQFKIHAVQGSSAIMISPLNSDYMILKNGSSDISTKIYYDQRNLSSEGWFPAQNTFGSDFLVSLDWFATGAFQIELGLNSWVPNAIETKLHDDGLNGDRIAGDGILTFQFVTSSNLNDSQWIAVNPGPVPASAWDGSIKHGDDGWALDGGPTNNASFDAQAGDTVTLEFDAIHGRMRSVVE